MSVFISYRSEGGKHLAESIYKGLCAEYDVFLDTESLRSGHLDSAIIERIKSCTDFLLIITENVVDRGVEPEDWIHQEATIAFEENKNIIPIFVGIQNFPLNIPDSIKSISRYNGILWTDSVTTINKIKSFLLSNKRYILTVEKSEFEIILSAASKEELKKLYRAFVKNGRSTADVEISIPNPVELSKLLIEDNVIATYGISVAEHMAQQSLLKKFYWIKETLEIAIEYMLQDEMLDACAIRRKELYIKKYGITKCGYTDDEGLDNFYWTPFLWFEIIEEMLKELLYDRYETYGSIPNMIAIDCFAKTRSGKEIWGFLSYVLGNRNADEKSKLVEVICKPGGRADYMDIPLIDLVEHVYPDFYYNIGLLKSNKTMYSFEAVSKYNGIFNLWYYCFGLH